MVCAKASIKVLMIWLSLLLMMPFAQAVGGAPTSGPGPSGTSSARARELGDGPGQDMEDPSSSDDEVSYATHRQVENELATAVMNVLRGHGPPGQQASLQVFFSPTAMRRRIRSAHFGGVIQGFTSPAATNYALGGFA